MTEVMIVTGAGQISLAILRRVGSGKKIIIGDKQVEKAQTMAEQLQSVGFDVEAIPLDLGKRETIRSFVDYASQVGEISLLVNGAGVSPSQATIQEILAVDLLGTAILLEEVGKVIKKRGAGVIISSQSGHRLPAFTPSIDQQLACTATDDLLSLDILQPENIEDTLHAYQLAKRCNEKRVMAEAVKWGKRGARINAISPGIIVTPLAVDEFNGPRGPFYTKMFRTSPAGRPGTADEVANVAELLLTEKGAYITGSDFLIDGGATATYFYGNSSSQNDQN